jgi:osmotically-inducible protein OsmY
MNKSRHALWLLLALALAGCNRTDTEALSRIAKKVQARAEAATGDVKTSAASSWNAVGEYGLDGRVTARLRWDRELAGASIEAVRFGNAVELRGKVRDYEQRRRAIMIAETTVGVETVKDALVEGG